MHKTSKTLVTALLFAAGTSWAQQTTPAATAADAAEEEVIILSPFEVSAEEEQGYMAATTLAGNRLNTELRDIGNAVTVITSQFLTDIGATSNESLLQYTVGTEVGNVFGNFAGTGDGAFLNESGRFVNPNNNTRVRGLTAADNTRDYFLTNVPWDSYNVDRVDLQRGPNSILFGQGSPAGIINVGTKQARFRNANEAEVRVTDEGGIRGTLDINRVLLKDELAFRIIGLYNDEQFKQKPAYAIDKRLYSAVRYEPKLLKRGNARTILKGNYEVGEISSNRPRQLPPIDRITPWFQSGTYQGRNNRNEPYTYNHLNRLTLNGSQAQDDNTSLPNHGQQRPSYNGGPLGGTPNLYYNPMLGNFGQQFGNPLGYVDGTGDGGVNHYWTAEPRFPRAIGPSGAIDGNLGNPYQRPLGVASYGDFAKNARLPFAEFGIYKNKNLTDPSVFDFYNNLLEGPNKKEWRHFRIYNFSLAQTFFNDKMGIELTYNNERDRSGQLSMLNGQNQAIYIDIMSVYADGTNRGTGTPNQSWNKVTGEPFQDGTPNPNLGRPFLNDNPSGNESVQDRENKRATVFVTHDFEKEGSDNLFGRILGKHTLTGLYGEDRNKSDSRNWARYSTDVPTLKNFLFGPNNTTNWDANEFRPMPVVYLGPSLLSSSTAVGANIPNPSVEINMMGGGLRTFDSTWNRPTNPTAAGYVNPAAFWGREYYPADQGPYNSTQSENPANYIGWRDISLPVYDSEQGYRDFNTQGATLRKDTLTSKAITWQGHFWNNALVGTYGYREDTAKSWSYNRNVNTSGNYQDNRMNLSPAVYKLPDAPSNRVDVISRAYTIVAHLNDMPFLDGLTEKLPILVSLFYNNSTNFQPAAQRVDVYGEPHPAPQGETTDAGILLETRDGKYTLKINKYETTATNATSSAMSNPGFIGTAQQYGARWANRFEFNWTQDTNAGAVTPNDPTNNQYNYGLAPGETLEQAQAREAGVIAAWRAWQKSVDPRFGPAWRFDYSNPAVNPSVSQPSGFTLTEDAVSEGYEIELSALPTKNWRLALNAAQSEARRTNIGDANIQAFVKSFETALRTTPAGDLRIWWGGAGNDTILKLWNESFGSEWVQRRLQEGSNVPELREWRLNAISNYEFDHGALKGFNFGAGVRYQSDVIIGYKPLPGATANEISFDLEDPYKGPAETNLDLWVGYRRMISRNVEWHVQLNVRNAFEGDDLIPINVQPDGSAAGYRIAPYQTFTLSNRFTF